MSVTSITEDKKRTKTVVLKRYNQSKQTNKGTSERLRTDSSANRVWDFLTSKQTAPRLETGAQVSGTPARPPHAGPGLGLQLHLTSSPASHPTGPIEPNFPRDVRVMTEHSRTAGT